MTSGISPTTSSANQVAPKKPKVKKAPGSSNATAPSANLVASIRSTAAKGSKKKKKNMYFVGTRATYAGQPISAQPYIAPTTYVAPAPNITSAPYIAPVIVPPQVYVVGPHYTTAEVPLVPLTTTLTRTIPVTTPAQPTVAPAPAAIRAPVPVRAIPKTMPAQPTVSPALAPAIVARAPASSPLRSLILEVLDFNPTPLPPPSLTSTPPPKKRRRRNPERRARKTSVIDLKVIVSDDDDDEYTLSMSSTSKDPPSPPLPPRRPETRHEYLERLVDQHQRDRTLIWQLDPELDQEQYREVEKYFLEQWTKKNATNVQVESILEVRSRVRDQFVAYRMELEERKGYEKETMLFHGTNSCQGRYHYTLQDGSQTESREQLCYREDCSTCGILAYGFDKTRSGQGSIARGLPRVWQRFGHGIYFSSHSSKCHFYSKTGNSGYHPTTGRNYASMVVAKVLLGVPHYATQSTQAEEAWKGPPDKFDSVIGLPGCGNLNYEESVVYRHEAVLPTAVVTYSFTATSEY